VGVDRRLFQHFQPDIMHEFAEEQLQPDLPMAEIRMGMGTSILLCILSSE
jgi:hypothetical protein